MKVRAVEVTLSLILQNTKLLQDLDEASAQCAKLFHYQFDDVCCVQYFFLKMSERDRTLEHLIWRFERRKSPILSRLLSVFARRPRHVTPLPALEAELSFFQFFQFTSLFLLSSEQEHIKNIFFVFDDDGGGILPWALIEYIVSDLSPNCDTPVCEDVLSHKKHYSVDQFLEFYRVNKQLFFHLFGFIHSMLNSIFGSDVFYDLLYRHQHCLEIVQYTQTHKRSMPVPLCDTLQRMVHGGNLDPFRLDFLYEENENPVSEFCYTTLSNYSLANLRRIRLRSLISNSGSVSNKINHINLSGASTSGRASGCITITSEKVRSPKMRPLGTASGLEQQMSSMDSPSHRSQACSYDIGGINARRNNHKSTFKL